MEEFHSRKVLDVYKKMMLGMFVLIVAAGIVLGIFNRSDDFITVTQDDVLVFAPEGGETLRIDLRNVRNIELIEDLDIKEIGDPGSGKGYTYGEGTAEGVGALWYYAYHRADAFIVIADGKNTVAFNYYSDQNTKEFYTALLDLIGEVRDES